MIEFLTKVWVGLVVLAALALVLLFFLVPCIMAVWMNSAAWLFLYIVYLLILWEKK